MNKSPSRPKCFLFGRHWASKRFQKKNLLYSHRGPRKKDEDQERILMPDLELSDSESQTISQGGSTKGKVQDEKFSIEKISGIFDTNLKQDLERISANDQELSYNITELHISSSTTSLSDRKKFLNDRRPFLNFEDDTFEGEDSSLKDCGCYCRIQNSSTQADVSFDLERISSKDRELSYNITESHIPSSTTVLSDGFIKNRKEFLNDRRPFMNFEDDTFEGEDSSLKDCGCDCRIQNSSTQADVSFDLERISSNDRELSYNITESHIPSSTTILSDGFIKNRKEFLNDRRPFMNFEDDTFEGEDSSLQDCGLDCRIRNSSTQADVSFGRFSNVRGLEEHDESGIGTNDGLSNYIYPHFDPDEEVASTGFNIISGQKQSPRNVHYSIISSARKQSPRNGKCRHFTRSAPKKKFKRRKPYYKHQQFGRIAQKYDTRRTCTETKVSKGTHQHSPTANCSQGFSSLHITSDRNPSPSNNQFDWNTSRIELENQSRQDYPTSTHSIEGKYKEQSSTDLDVKSQSHKNEDDSIQDCERNMSENENHFLAPKSFVHVDVHARVSNEPAKSADFESLFNFKDQICSEMFKECRLRNDSINSGSINNLNSGIYGSVLEKLQPKSRQRIYIRNDQEIPESTLINTFYPIEQADLPIRNLKKHPIGAAKCNGNFLENNYSSILEPNGGPATHSLIQSRHETVCSDNANESFIGEKTNTALLTSGLQTNQLSKSDATDQTFVCTSPETWYFSLADSAKRKCRLRRQKFARLERNKRPWKLNKNQTHEKYPQVTFEVNSEPYLPVSERVKYFNNISEPRCESSTALPEKSPNYVDAMDNKDPCAFPKITESDRNIYGNYDVIQDSISQFWNISEPRYESSTALPEKSPNYVAMDNKDPCAFPKITETDGNIYGNYDVIQGNFSQFWNRWEETLGLRTSCRSTDSESLINDLRKILDERHTESRQSEYELEEDDYIVPEKEDTEKKLLEEIARNTYSKPKNDTADNIGTKLKRDVGSSYTICEKKSCTVEEATISKVKEGLVDVAEASSLKSTKIKEVVGGIRVEKRNIYGDVEDIDGLKLLLTKLIRDADEISSKLEEVQDEADEISSKLKEVQDAADQFSSKLEEVQDEADEISSKLEEVQHAADEISSKLEEVQHAADEFSSKLEEVQHAADEFSSKLEEVQDEADEIS
ncbi:hypothetical protein JTE90_015924 [Oedothorax gibbosus]|uniref:Uncharacterized protein n=1 Tax=Oedothorax gibbosus TaxID=931172 RepID=A0AAV6TZT8_9ARAC|nr:hypothetical protein JTE90_015924 [Oedothorax gibbosus]